MFALWAQMMNFPVYFVHPSWRELGGNILSPFEKKQAWKVNEVDHNDILGSQHCCCLTLSRHLMAPACVSHVLYRQSACVHEMTRISLGQVPEVGNPAESEAVRFVFISS